MLETGGTIMVTQTRNGLKQSPLKRRTPLNRGNGDGLKKTARSRNSTLSPRSPKEQYRIDIWAGVTFTKWLENDGKCERCQDKVPRRYPAHHKIKSRFNDDTIKNACTLCPSCHDWVGQHHSEAIKEGFSIRGY